MPSALPSSAPYEENRRAALVRLRIAIVKLRAQCRTAAATIAELRAAVSSLAPEPPPSRGVRLLRVNHDMAAVARTAAEVDALRSLASPAMVRDIETNGRSRGSLERELDDLAALAGDLRVVRRSESIMVAGPEGGSVSVIGLVVSLEWRTAAFRIVDLRATAPKREAAERRRPRMSVRSALREFATSLLGRRLVARGA